MGRAFNTLAQNGTEGCGNDDEKLATIIAGQGSELGAGIDLKGRAKRKAISQVMALKLISTAEQQGHTDRLKTFWNTYHCHNRVVTHEGRLHGRYCKNRLCTLCCSIRKADIINRYYPVICRWEQPYFVTLTIKACPAKGLKLYLAGIIKAIKRIVEKYRKRHQRGDCIKLKGIKAVECNFNVMKKTYNPHVHLIVANEEMAKIFVKEWLGLWKSGYTSPLAQKIRPVRDLQRDLIEVIKYGSKIFTEPDVNKKARAATNNSIYIRALYNITEGMSGLRIFDRFGFDLPKIEKKPHGARVVSNYQEWLFDLKYFDWLNAENELVLTGYEPPSELVRLLENNIDLDSC